MIIDDYDTKKLLHDLKRTARLVHVVKFEKDREQIKRLCDIILDELQKVEEDMNEIKEAHEKEKNEIL